ncbi:hypothetical protein EJ02DRAFT_514295 [Clathrospora elynae]|uniref:Uncharacterized protein n=1 Tax=Clathrospora elynae TaxID=706981 RepID=A0A6A5SNE6_9PLEO|nr:hypothetical protein EJ02DRAFT_514295 [Clathrospora elynae]
MRTHSFLAFPISLALLWSAANPLSYAAPAPLPVLALEIPSVQIPPHAAIPSETNTTTTHALVRRGCFTSKEEDLGPTTCDGSIPPASEIVAQLQRKGFVGTKVSAFYTRLEGRSAISLSKCWVNTHPAEIPNPPGAVFFDEIVKTDWEDSVGAAMSLSPGGTSKITSYQKLLSQIFAEQSSGTAWIFAPAALNFDGLDDRNTWKNWEFPALTQNVNIVDVRRTDPNDSSDPPSVTTIWRQGDPTQVPRGLVLGL